METKNNRYYSLLSLSLGDGCLTYSKNKDAANLDIAHHINHKDYILYKASVINSLGLSSFERQKQRAGNAQFRTSTKNIYILKCIKDKLYGTASKVFKKSWIKHLDAWSLSILWMDDGCICRKKKKRNDGSYYTYEYGDIALQSFDYDSLFNVILWLKLQFDIEAYIVKSRNLFTVRMNRDNLHKLIKVVSPTVCLVPSMLYKITI